MGPGKAAPEAAGAPPAPPRPAWGSKAQYILAQVGFSVGLGNVWRFPYLCHQNGGGAFLLLYVLLLGVLGLPLFFLELAAGQSIRQGSIGVWKSISPRLGGIGFASCLVCAFVALYYNVIIAWSLLYLGRSLQHPLPWQGCPNASEPECARSSPTTYFWYRETLDVAPSIGAGGGLQPALVGGLLGAWVLVGASLLGGIRSSGKVLYFSTLFPYAVLLCFLVRGLLLEGAPEGVRIMFTPKASAWGTGQAWRQAATQVFFALGLGFGSVIAYSSYNPRRNDCHRDALLVAALNAATSLLATLVVFAVLGFRATRRARACVARNAELLAAVAWPPELPPPPGNLSALAAPEYSAWLRRVPPALRGALGLSDCRLEDEMSKGVEGTGLAFIAFTETMTLLPASPFWSVLFFLMLLNLGLSTMLGTMQGILTPLQDNFPALRRRRALFTGLCCLGGFVLGLLFVQRSGSYFVAMFDDYSATLPLVAVVACEAVAVAWVYGAERFLADVEQMLGRRPWRLYGYMWRYGSLGAMLCLLLASLGQLCLSRPSYQAWDRDTATETRRPYPPWAVGLIVGLIVAAVLPIPLVLLRQLLRERRQRLAPPPAPPGHLDPDVDPEEEEEEEEESPADPPPPNGYRPLCAQPPPGTH